MHKYDVMGEKLSGNQCNMHDQAYHLPQMPDKLQHMHFHTKAISMAYYQAGTCCRVVWIATLANQHNRVGT